MTVVAVEAELGALADRLREAKAALLDAFERQRLAYQELMAANSSVSEASNTFLAARHRFLGAAGDDAAHPYWYRTTGGLVNVPDK